MAKVTQSVELHLALIWVHSTETFLQDVVEFIIEFEFKVRIVIEPRYSRTSSKWSVDPWHLGEDAFLNFAPRTSGRYELLMTDFRNDHIRYIWCDSESVDYLPVILPVLILDNDQSFWNFTDFWIEIKWRIWNHLRFWKLFNLNRIEQL